MNLLSPKPFHLAYLPNDSYIHHLTFTDENPEIDTSKLYLSHGGLLYVDEVDTLTTNLGHPRRKPLPIKNLSRPFFKQHKRYKFIREPYKTIHNRNAVLINNYNYLDTVYKYSHLTMTPYFRFYNAQKTMWETINIAATNSNRNNFVFVSLPKELVSVSLLKIYSNKANKALITIFNSPEKLFLLELWKWIDTETRDKSVIGSISTENLSKVTLMLQLPDGRVSMINLGYINSWIIGSPNITPYNNVV